MKFPVAVWQGMTGSQIRLCEEISFVGKGGWVYMGRRYLAGKVGVSIWQVSRITSRLVEMGVLEKMQRRYRRSNGTWDTRPCVYRVVGWLRWKLQNLLYRAGVRSGARRAKLKEKVAYLDLSFMKDEKKKGLLERFGKRKTPP
jgi:hypothetical protein